MRILITGICGFAGSTLARRLRELKADLKISGVDNFIRKGSERNRGLLRELGIEVQHADIRIREDVESLPKVDWIIDGAANPSVLAGTAGHSSSSRSLMEHNLGGTLHLLEYSKLNKCGLILLSTSRVYSGIQLNSLKLRVFGEAFRPEADQVWPLGSSSRGITEQFCTAPPLSLYGSSKLCSEILACEYSRAFGFPLWINRLGVLAGAGQFGRADQGIFSYWIHSSAEKKKLNFVGYGGRGYQVRDALHPQDLASVLIRQMDEPPKEPAITNFSGGVENSMSLKELDNWCQQRFGKHEAGSQLENRMYDVPWLVLDCLKAKVDFNWQPETPLNSILNEIADHAERHPNWLELAS
jgi:CDP-paratose 2-epimerase